MKHLRVMGARAACGALIGASVCLLACGALARAQEGDLLIGRERLDREAPAPEAEAPLIATPSDAKARVVVPAPFILRGVEIEGASLATARLQAAVAPFQGRRIDSAELERMVAALAALYAHSDIALYSIAAPAQDFADGRVRLQVIEGHIAHVALLGDVAGDTEIVRRHAGALAGERPLRRRTFERNLLLVSDIPGLSTTARLAPSSEPGGLNLGLHMERRRYDGRFVVHNRGGAALGRAQIELHLIANGLMRLGDETRLTLGADADFERAFALALAHARPIGHEGARLALRASHLRTDTPATGRGEASALNIGFSYPMIRSQRRNLTYALALDGLDSDNAVLGEIVAEERTRVLRASASYADLSGARSFTLRATLSQGLDGLGAHARNPSVALDFTKLNVQAGYTRSLSRAWLVRLHAGAQASGKTLPVSERFALGGRYGRAFDAAVLTGDDGAGAGLELAWRPSSAEAFISELYGFTDYGWVRRNAPPPGVAGDDDLSSAGLGARLRLSSKVSFDLEAGRALDAPAPLADSWRGRFGFSARF